VPSITPPAKKTGINDFRFHDLRHTTASWIIQNGGDLLMVKEVLGHKTLQSSYRYTHLAEGQIKGVMNKIMGGKLAENSET